MASISGLFQRSGGEAKSGEALGEIGGARLNRKPRHLANHRFGEIVRAGAGEALDRGGPD